VGICPLECHYCGRFLISIKIKGLNDLLSALGWLGNYAVHFRGARNEMEGETGENLEDSGSSIRRPRQNDDGMAFPQVSI